MTTERYLRNLRLEVGDDTGTRLVIDRLRVAFAIRLSAQPDNEPSEVAIYNLARATEARIVGAKAVSLRAGYGDEHSLLHVGRIDRVRTERQGLERITTLTLDAGNAISRTGALYAASVQNIRLHALIEDIVVGLMRLPLGYLGDIPDETVGSFVWQGSAKDALTALLRPRGVEWYIANEEVLFSARGKFEPVTPLLVSQETGMIGVPSLTETGVRAQKTLDPRLRLGAPVSLLSEAVSGVYKITSLEHRGDNWEGEWLSEFEAKVV